MNFKLEYLNEKKINKFINKYEFIDLVIFETITYASGIGVGMNNQARSKTKCHNIDKNVFIEPSGFNNNLVEKSISLRGEGKLGYQHLHLAYYEDDLPQLLKSYIEDKINEYKCTISIKKYDYNNLKKLKSRESYFLDTFRSDNIDNTNELKIATAVKANENLSYITYSIKHYETTENQIGFYKLILNEITIFDQEEESLFYIIQNVIAQYKDINLTKIQIPRVARKEKYIKYNIIPRLEQNLYFIEYL